ncbi:NAD-binding protein [Massilia dura]|uniref:NAD-binding protein n=1 Tax=Pseudoduganella dura TaxID=321982 RepID=A0A6I3XF55_9BURK|nr:NAD(P)-dependent oxidoreductase [Pseudoduganella dura]MUI11358.1 NAD-binding protein [Pseudoduganella dura]GGX95633.1 2-hydroxy-3-oxopropionate reductase [Pseudoduganella dura]
MSEPTIGFIGLGNMGGPMATRLAAAGYPLVVCDPSARAVAALVERGARSVETAAEVGAQAEIILVSLPTPDVVQEVAFGPEGLIHGGKARILVDLSTTGPKAAVQIAARLAESGITAMDAPVSGGVASAVKGSLALMVSGPRAVYDELQPVLAHLGKLFFCGDKAGLGQTLKLANNLMSAAALAVTSEALAMGVKAGLDPTVMIDVINASSGRNSASVDKFPRAVIPRTFDFGFATGLSYKDARLCVEEAEALGVPMIVGSAVRQMLAVTNATFGPQSDFTCIAKVVEQWAGVQIGNSTEKTSKE